MAKVNKKAGSAPKKATGPVAKPKKKSASKAPAVKAGKAPLVSKAPATKSPATVTAVKTPPKAEKKPIARTESPLPATLSSRKVSLPPPPKKEKTSPQQESSAVARPAPVHMDEEAEKHYRQWMQLKEQHKGDETPAYILSGSYKAKAPLQHKVLGWGYVLKSRPDRIEVLFESGLKTLVCNYKAPA